MGRSVSRPGDVSCQFEWVLVESDAPDSIILRYEAVPGASFRQARVRESETEILIEMFGVRNGMPPGHAWAPHRQTPLVTIKLKAPIAGRRILGQSPVPVGAIEYLVTPAGDPGDPDKLLPAVPRVLGLNPDDAIALLDAQRFDTTLEGSGSLVIAQVPNRGAAPADHGGHVGRSGTVRLKLGDA